MKPIQVAFATSEKLNELFEDDQSILGDLFIHGIEAIPVVWDHEQDWKKYDCIVIRSTWDYWSKIEQFRKWIRDLDKEKTKLFNPTSVLLDNTNKIYLKRLKQRGVAIPKTTWMDSSDSDLTKATKILGGEEFVLKPTVSAGAYRTYRFKKADCKEYEGKLKEITGESVAMLQPLISTILSEGEYSFVFFGGEYSHSVLKVGAEGEFRIQRTYGGTVQSYEATPGEIAQAKAALTAYCDPKALVYARVDMVRDPNDFKKFLLMELELTEPNLFFMHAQNRPKSVKLFAEALIGRLQIAN